MTGAEGASRIAPMMSNAWVALVGGVSDSL